MIPLFKVFTADTVMPELAKVFASGMIGQDKKNEEFEKVLRAYFNEAYINTVNSATSAEHLTYHLLKKYGLQAGDTVLTTALSCLATHTPMVAEGLKIQWVDIDPTNLNIDLDDLERKLSPNTKVITVVHWGGNPVDLTRLSKIKLKCQQMYGFYPVIVEDCAHSLGAKFNNKLIGTHGNICTFSLQAIKLINSGDGGFVISPGWEDFYRRGRIQRWFGLDRDNPEIKDMRCFLDCEQTGHKFHMNDINSTIGLENFKHVDRLLKAHQDNAAFYNKELANVSGVTLLERHPASDPSYWIYSMLVEDRDGFNAAMKAQGIATSMVHDRVDKHSCFKDNRSSLPSLDKTIGKVTNIPVGWWVTPEDREYIVQCIKAGW